MDGRSRRIALRSKVAASASLDDSMMGQSIPVPIAV
jgi:hypothetical protein